MRENSIRDSEVDHNDLGLLHSYPVDQKSLEVKTLEKNAKEDANFV